MKVGLFGTVPVLERTPPVVGRVGLEVEAFNWLAPAVSVVADGMAFHMLAPAGESVGKIPGEVCRAEPAISSGGGDTMVISKMGGKVGNVEASSFKASSAKASSAKASSVRASSGTGVKEKVGDHCSTGSMLRAAAHLGVTHVKLAMEESQTAGKPRSSSRNPKHFSAVHRC